MAAARKIAGILLVGLLATAGWHYFARQKPSETSELTAAFPDGVKAEFILKFDAATAETTNAVRFKLDSQGRPHFLAGRNVIAVKHSPGSQAELIPLPGSSHIGDFAWMRDGSLLLIEETRLMALTKSGLKLVQELPQAGMRVAPASVDQCYLFGGETTEQQRNVYLYRKGGGLLHLLQAGSPIAAVAGNGEYTFVGINGTICLLVPGSALAVVCRTKHPVNSLAIGPDSSLFFSTPAGVGISSGPGDGHLFIRGQGAEIQLWNEDLYLYFPKLGILRCTPASRFPKAAPAEKTSNAI